MTTELPHHTGPPCAVPAVRGPVPGSALVDSLPTSQLARTSTLEHQDPRASLRRQIRSVRDWLPAGWFIAAVYWDIESGAIDLEQRSQGEAYKAFADAGIPATGEWPTCSPRPRPRHPDSPPWSARTSSGPAATPSTR